jgi:hypothetical protein
MTAQTEIAHVVDYLVPEDETPECVEDCPACLAALPDEYEPADPDASAAVAPTGPYAARRNIERALSQAHQPDRIRADPEN